MSKRNSILKQREYMLSVYKYYWSKPEENHVLQAPFSDEYAGSWHLGQSSVCQKWETCLLDLK